MFKILERIEAMLKTISSPMRIIAAFSEIERELGIVGLSDFHFVSPTAFAAPDTGAMRVYGQEHFERLFWCVPSFQHLAHRFHRLGTSEITYVAAATSFGGEIHHGDSTYTFRSSDLAAAFGGEQTSINSGAEIIRLTPGTYDRGAVVVALPAHLAERHLQWADRAKSSLRVRFVDSEVTLPLSCLVGVVQRSSGREAMLVEQVLRAYWQRLQGQYGYRARCEGPYWLCEGKHGHDPENGALPKELVKVQKVNSDLPDIVELDSEYGARGLLECWVRLAKIVKLIEQHQEKHPIQAVA